MAALDAALALAARGSVHNETRREMASAHLQPLIKTCATLLEDPAVPARVAAALLAGLARLVPLFPGPLRPFKDNLQRLCLALCWDPAVAPATRDRAALLVAALPRVVGARDMPACWTLTCQQLVASTHHVLSALCHEVLDEDGTQWQDLEGLPGVL